MFIQVILAIVENSYYELYLEVLDFMKNEGKVRKNE